MNGVRHPWQRPLLPQFVTYGLVLASFVAFTLALLVILLASSA